MYDCHMHCEHSHDTSTPIEDMIRTAIDKGGKYISFSDHLDRDFLYDNSIDEHLPQLDLDKHIDEVIKMRVKYAGIIDIAVGVECGFSLASSNDYKTMLENKKIDVVLNSIHSVSGVDCYYDKFFEGLSKKQAYEKYLLSVYDSVICDYDYNIITHIGYVCRKAPYLDKSMSYSDYTDIIDMIFKAMIARGVTLEINTHTKSESLAFLPYLDILDRYFELGGEEFSYGSDAHRIDRVGEKYNVVRDYLLSKNVKYINTFKDRKVIKNLL